MSRPRTMKRLGNLYTKRQLMQLLADEKGYRIDELKIFFKDLEDMVTEILSNGNSVILPPMIYLEIVEHPAHKKYDFKTRGTVDYPAYPVLRVHAGENYRKRLFKKADEKIEEFEEYEDENIHYGYND